MAQPRTTNITQSCKVLVNDQREHPSSSLPLILVNDQREHPSSSSPLMFLSQSVSQSRKLNSTCVTDIGPTACPRTRTSEMVALFGNSPNCVSTDTHFGDGCLIWQLAQLRVHGHALRRCLPYLATCLTWQLAELRGGHHALGRHLPYMATG